MTTRDEDVSQQARRDVRAAVTFLNMFLVIGEPARVVQTRWPLGQAREVIGKPGE